MRKEVIKMEKKFWENIAYLSLACCIFGNITVGWFFLLAQYAYLIANGVNFIRSMVLKRPTADKVRDLSFLVITIGLIVIRTFG